MIPFNPAPLLFLTPCSSDSCFVEITRNLLHQPTYLHTARNTILSEFSANPTRFQIINIYHSRKSWLLLAILPVFRWDDKRKFSSWGKKQHCRVLGGVFFSRLLCTKYYWMAWLQNAEYSGPHKLAGKNALQQDAVSAIKLKGGHLPLDNPEETSEDPCCPSVSSEVHWLLHGSSDV